MTGTEDDGDSRRTLAARRGLETEVYEPAEDSALLAEAAADVVEPGWRVLDVGTGTGYVAEAITEAVEVEVVASDVNPVACRRADDRGLRVVRADLVTPFADDAFHAVLFNPPYLPTPAAPERDDWLERALSGGETGRDVVTPFVRDVGRVLAPGGVALLLVSSLTGIEAVGDVASDAGLDAEPVAEASYPYERLVVLALRPAA